jgi:hypothetical protein
MTSEDEESTETEDDESAFDVIELDESEPTDDSTIIADVELPV